MDILFSKILSMSLSASFVIAAVLLLRLLLQRAPKKYSYFLWLLVFFRLLCPFTIESGLSPIPVKEDAIVYQSSTEGSMVKVDTGIAPMDQVVTRGISVGSEVSSRNSGISKDEQVLKDNGISEDGLNMKAVGWLETVFSLMPMVWGIGIVALMIKGMVQVFWLRRKLKTAVLLNMNVENMMGKDTCPVYESEYINTAFLFGFIHLRIYIPLGIEEERGYVIAHEMVHKKRLDYLVKPVCYLAVILHWFNPLVWLSFALMIKDMEMACDEQVLMSATKDIRGTYTKSLLNLSVKGSGLSIPLAFGETNIKARIKHALKYKKPSAWIGVGAILVIFIATVTLLTSNTGGEGDNLNSQNEQEAQENQEAQETQEAQEIQEIQEISYQLLSENRNAYIGDATATGQLIQLLPDLQGYERGGIKLHTDEKPYQLEIFYKKTEPLSVREEQENNDIMGSNAVYLFATIENMDVCSFSLDKDGIVYQTSYSREEIEEVFGDLYARSATPEGLEELAEEMDAYWQKMEEALSSTITKEDMTNIPETITAEASGDMVAVIDNMISQAIIKYAKSQYEAYSEHVEVHIILGGEEYVAQQLLESDKEMVFYILARDDAGENRGSCFAAKVTISIREDGTYQVTDFWIPRDGSYLKPDIEEEFPEEFWDDATFMDDQLQQLEEKIIEKKLKLLE